MNINIETLKRIMTPEELAAGNVGVEREGLRVTAEGKLAMTPHPTAFGDKLTNPYITTDFSESQIEVVTPTHETVDGAYDMLVNLCNIVEDELAADEFFWPQSMPCDIPEDEDIPIAHYKGEEDAQSAMDYRRGLLKKYGGKKQLISGIHFNFSFPEAFIEKLHMALAPDMADAAFKDAVYLKVTRNYLRYRWLVIYLTGCSVGLHQSYIPGCVAQMSPVDDKGSYLETTGPSFRNSACGYKNITPLFPDYTTVATFTRDVRGFMEKGYLSAPKELYTQVRLKSKEVADVLGSLEKDGIAYLEIRTMDLNVFDPCGIAKIDMTFLHRLMFFLLVHPEESEGEWQSEALVNEEKTAMYGLDPNLVLCRNGQAVPMSQWATEILEAMKAVNTALGLPHGEVIEAMLARVIHPETTYASRLMTTIKEEGYLAPQLAMAVDYKAQSQKRKKILVGHDTLDETAQAALKADITAGKRIH